MVVIGAESVDNENMMIYSSTADSDYDLFFFDGEILTVRKEKINAYIRFIRIQQHAESS